MNIFFLFKDHLNSKNENQKENMDAKPEKLQRDILKQHPFLSYDSEDYFNENERNLQMQVTFHELLTTNPNFII